MWRSTSVPNLLVKFVRWLNDDEFIALHESGSEVICHKDYWEEIDKDERKEG